ncbi:pyrazinamidase/nicotinamidase [Crucibulum laeve]|uniref:nicotinamidase n=1 Tax=Crucibulum laeve TaxID=68775 RepID=A0A5C3ML53_9AGAR|nr:pyrazinamidase/nicotinamidase [Crucibulum laeve]
MSVSDLCSTSVSTTSSADISSPGSESTSTTPKYTPALIIIDMQNDFVYGTLAVPDAATIIEPVNSLIDLPFKVKVATRDFHPDSHISFAETHRKPLFSTTMIYHPEDPHEIMGMQQVLWPIHCVAYTGGADFVPGLKTTEFDAVVHKGTHPNIESYSAFRDIWHKAVSELPDILASHGITDVYFAGLAGDYCVKYTALDAVEFGYKSWVVTDAVKSISQDQLAFEEMKKKGVELITCEDLMARLNAFGD